MKTTAYSRSHKRATCNGLHCVTESQYRARVDCCADCDNTDCPYKKFQCWRVVTQCNICPLKKWAEIVKVKGKIETGEVL